MTGTGLLTTVQAREKVPGAPCEDELNPQLAQPAAGQGCSAEQVFAARSVFDQAGRLLDEFLRATT